MSKSADPSPRGSAEGEDLTSKVDGAAEPVRESVDFTISPDMRPSSRSEPPAAAHITRIKEGVLKKKSQGMWSSRYYVLYKDLLVYSRTQNSKPAGVIPLQTYHFASQVANDKDAAAGIGSSRFDLLVKGFGGKVHTFCFMAPSPEEAREWVAIIKAQAKAFEIAHPHLKAVHLSDQSFSGKFWHNPAQMILLARTWETGGDRSSILATKFSSTKYSISQSATNLSFHQTHGSKHHQESIPEDEDSQIQTRGRNASRTGSGAEDDKTTTTTRSGSPLKKRSVSPGGGSQRGSIMPNFNIHLSSFKVGAGPMRQNRGTSVGGQQDMDNSNLAATAEIMRLNAKARGTLHLSGVLKIKETVNLPGNNVLAGVYRWHKRYFALYDEVLMFYKAKGGDPVGGALVPDIVVIQDNSQPACFEIQVVEPGAASSHRVSYTLLCRTPNEAEQWITALKVQTDFHSYKKMLDENANPNASSATTTTTTIAISTTTTTTTTSSSSTSTSTSPPGGGLGALTLDLSAEQLKAPSEPLSPTSTAAGLSKDAIHMPENQGEGGSANSTAHAGHKEVSHHHGGGEDDEDGLERTGQPFSSFACLSEKGFIVEMEKENQDFQIHQLNFAGAEHRAAFVVCDGHGPVGHLVSNFVGKTLLEVLSGQKELAEKPCKSIRAAFQEVSQRLAKVEDIDCTYSGTTCILCYFDGSTVYSCNTGDCRAVLGKRMDVWDCLAVPLSCDHKPARPDEKRRIEAANGRCEPKKGIQGDIGSARVWLKDQDIPGLAVSRAFGDSIAASVGVISQPEIWRRRIQTNDAFIILASDGVWEFISSEEAVDIVAQAESAEEATQHLVEEAKKRWAQEDWEARDDITCQIIFF